MTMGQIATSGSRNRSRPIRCPEDLRTHDFAAENSLLRVVPDGTATELE